MENSTVKIKANGQPTQVLFKNDFLEKMEFFNAYPSRTKVWELLQI